MLTRCPHCQTSFRVTPEQLKVRAGRVRCGACRQAFNALDSLSDEPLIVVPAGHEPAEPSSAPPQADVPEAAETATAESGAAETEAAGADIEPTAEAAIEPVAETASEMPVEPASETPDEPASEPAPAAMPEEIPPEAATFAETAVISEEAVASPPAAPAEPPESRRWEDGSAPAATPSPPEPDEEAVAPIEPPAPPRRWPWAVGSVLLFLLALGQLIYLYRVELAVLLPETRPALVAACELLGCELPYPRRPELVSIESSDLAPLDDGRLLLTAALKNRAPFAQEYPYLELTLTDAADAALVRRVLAPAEWLPAGTQARAGFPAGGEVGVKLELAAPGVPAAGYRLYLFYP